MAKRKTNSSDEIQVVDPEPGELEEPERAEHKPELEPAKQTTCGHVNRHWTGEGEMACELPAGHAGPHQAVYARLNQDETKDAAVSVWSDAAGVAIP